MEQVQREIDEFKAEQEVFACTGIDETCGYGDELCLCRDPEAKPWVPCPLHEGG